MNGINMNMFLGGSDFFNPLKNKEVDGKKSTAQGKVVVPGREKKEQSDKMTMPQDTVDIGGDARRVKQAGYSKPAMKVQKEQVHKAIDQDGVQEGVELSEDAKNLLNTLKEKYGNMDFYIADTSTEAEAAYYMNQGSKEYSVLIDPETLEKMAADEEVLSKYEGILDGTDEMFDSIKEEIGEEDLENVGVINVTFDKEGNVSYIAEILDSMTANKNENHADKKKSTKVKANSVEELVAKMKEKIAEKKKAEEERIEKQETSEDEVE